MLSGQDILPDSSLRLSKKYYSISNKYLKNTSPQLISESSNSNRYFKVSLKKGGDDNQLNQTRSAAAPSQNGRSCERRNVETGADYYRQPLFDQNSVFIYPGAILNATDIINGQFSNYNLPNAYERRPYQVSADLYTMTGSPQDPTEVIGDNGESITGATYETAISSILSRNGAAHPPVDIFTEFIDATTKEEVAIKLGYNINASIPAELMLILAEIPVGIDASLNAGVTSTINTSKSRVLLKVNYNYFTVLTSPENMDSRKLLTPTPGNDLPNNLVYVSSVLYGTTGYVYFESDQSTSELLTTLNETIALTGPLDQGEASLTISAEARAKFQRVVTKMIASGRGLGLNSPRNINTLESLLNLIGTVRPWGPDNHGRPIGYTMNFIKDNNQAIVSYTTKFPVNICTNAEIIRNMRFDVDLELDNIYVTNINGGMGDHEELYGKLKFTYFKAGNNTVDPDKIFFSKSENNSGNQSFTNGTRAVDERKAIIRNITYNELRNAHLYIAGELYDDEGIFGSRNYKCEDCNEFSGVAYGKRKVHFIDLSSTQNSINSLLPNNEFQALKFGEDHFLELNFYESGKKSDGWVRARWKVLVKPHL